MSDVVKRLGVAEVTALIAQTFPQVHEGSGPLEIEALPPSGARVVMRRDPRMMRPGGTVAGPAMFKLADFTVYVAILGERGEAALEAVTTSMTMNFLKRPMPSDMRAVARLIKLGRRLAVAEVEIYGDDEREMVAHATATYAMPPEKMR